MSLARRLAFGLVTLAALFLPPSRAHATCAANACNASDLASCCIGNTCTIDGVVNVTPPTPGAVCDFDFGVKNVVLTGGGRLVAGSNTVSIEAGTFKINAPAKILAQGTATTPGGNVTVTTSGLEPNSFFKQEGGAEALVDVSGGGVPGGGRFGGGTFTLHAGGPITFTTGKVVADGLATAPGSSGGTIFIDSTTTITIDVDVFARSGGTDGGSGQGGFVRLKAAGDVNLSKTVSKVVSIEGGIGGGGELDIDAGGTVTIGTGAVVRAHGFDGNGGSGGEVFIAGATVEERGELRVRGGGAGTPEDIGGFGGEIDIEARTGQLLIERFTTALDVDGAPGGDGGIVSLVTSSITAPPTTDGTIRIAGPISAQGFFDGGGGSIDATAGGEIRVEAGSPLKVSGEGGALGEISLSAVRDVTLDASINGIDPGGGGSFSIDRSRSTIINASVSMAPPLTTDGEGGEISVSADLDLTVTGGQILNAYGSTIGDGGLIDLTAGRDLLVDTGATLNADGGRGGELVAAGGAGGQIFLTAGSPTNAGNLTMNGTLTAQATATTVLGGGLVSLKACNVAIAGIVDSRGLPNSTNVVEARQALAVTGTVRATTTNLATFPVGTPPPSSAKTTPPWTNDARALCTAPNVPQSCLVPCPACGNAVVEFPEQCDPSSADRCTTGCTPTCRLETCGGGNACRDSVCDPVGGCFVGALPNGTPCDDASVCNGHETCFAGNCLPGAPPGCDDGNPCTTDCDPVIGCVTTSLPNGTSCSDDNPCNGLETCQAGSCEPGTLVVCPPGQSCIPQGPSSYACGTRACSTGGQCGDGNPCTADVCSGGACNNPALTGTSCADGTMCNGNEICSAGVCEPGTALDCNDGNACTTDQCDPALGCRHTAVAGCQPCGRAADCDDQSDCTTDDCPAGVCVNTVIPNCCVTAADCDDGNACTTDTCNAGTQLCAHAALNGTSCGDLCQAGTCQAGLCDLTAPVVCQDGDLCTNDACDPATGCVFGPVEGCCTGAAQCDDADACTADACDVEAHRCTHALLDPDCRTCGANADCDPDGRCGQSVCGPDGYCVANTPPDCNDGDPNTRDVCALDGSGAPQCQHQCLNDQPCADTDLCTDDQCQGSGGCVHLPKTRYDGVTCRLETMGQLLAAAGSDEVADKVRTKLEGLLARAGANLEAARAAGAGKRAKRKLGTTAKLLKGIVKTVDTALRKHRIAPALADALRQAAMGAGVVVNDLKANLTP